MPIDISQIGRHADTAKPAKSTLSDIFNRELSLGKQVLADRKKEQFYHGMQVLLNSGIDIRAALDLVTRSFSRKQDKVIFESVTAALIGGTGLSAAMEGTGKFSAYETRSIRIGEETGKIAEIITELAGYFKNKVEQRKKLTAALTYPVLVLLTSLGAVFFMLRFVVPMFGDVFIRFGGKLPYITSVIISLSNHISNNLVYYGLFLIVLTGGWFLLRDTPAYKKRVSHLVLHIPVLGELIRKVYLARFANTMSLLVSTDTPLLYALDLVREMIAFYPLSETLTAVTDDVLKGSPLHASVAKHPFYPEKFVEFIRIAEEVNQLAYFFKKLSDQYTEEVTHTAQTLSSVLEPLMIIFLGAIVGLILIAMYLPMFQLSNTI